MSDTRKFHRNRYREAVQWLQAIITLVFLLLIYVARGQFDNSFSASRTPDTPPIGAVEQESYWNDDFDYGFSASK